MPLAYKRTKQRTARKSYAAIWFIHMWCVCFVYACDSADSSPLYQKAFKIDATRHIQLGCAEFAQNAMISSKLLEYGNVYNIKHTRSRMEKARPIQYQRSGGATQIRPDNGRWNYLPHTVIDNLWRDCAFSNRDVFGLSYYANTSRHIRCLRFIVVLYRIDYSPSCNVYVNC